MRVERWHARPYDSIIREQLSAFLSFSAVFCGPWSAKQHSNGHHGYLDAWLTLSMFWIIVNYQGRGYMPNHVPRKRRGSDSVAPERTTLSNVMACNDRSIFSKSDDLNLIKITMNHFVRLSLLSHKSGM